MISRRASKGAGTSLWPREHGAYAQLALPLLTVLAIQMPTLGAIGFAICTVTGFLAHESLLVLIGRRGERRKREFGPAAKRHLLSLCAIGTTGLLVGITAAEPLTLVAFALLAGFAVGIGVLIWAGQEKTLPGELLVAATFSLAAVPVALASGISWPVASFTAIAWTTIFVLGTLTVHAVLRRAKIGSTAYIWTTVLLAVVAMVSAIALVVSGSLWPAAVVPPAIGAVSVVALGVTPKHLRRVGWSLVAVDGLAWVVLVWGLRAAEHLGA